MNEYVNRNKVTHHSSS